MDGAGSGDRRPRDKPDPERRRAPEARGRGERVYDSFVVRLWREVGNRRLLRVEIEHTQSGGVTRGRGVALGWIGPRLAALLADARSPPAQSPTEPDDPSR